MRRVAILVTGSRAWSDYGTIEKALLRVQGRHPDGVFTLIHGDAPGADEIAANEAFGHGWTVLPMPAPWDAHGKAAGPARNREMVKVLGCLAACGYECHVLAFPLPESKGTWNCVRQAEDAGFDVTVVEAEPAP